MRYLTLLIVLLLTTANYAQKVDNISISTINAEYIDVTTDNTNSFSGKTKVYLDYGQEVKSTFSTKELIINNDNGKPMYFYSEVGVLNYFYKQGYHLIKVYKIKRDQYTQNGYLFSKTAPIIPNTCTHDLFKEYKEQ